jgi:hypothetical protein
MSALPAPSSGPGLPPSPRSELARLITSRFPLVYVDTVEEPRAVQSVREAAAQSTRRTWTWTISRGLTPDGPMHEDAATRDPVAALKRIAEQPGDDVFIMLDLARHVALNDTAERILRDLARERRTTVVLVGPLDAVPEALRGSAAVYELPRPDDALIAERLRATIEWANSRHGVMPWLDGAGTRQLVTALRGLTLEQVDQVLTHVLFDDNRLDAADIERALAEKGRILSSGGVLSLETPTQGLEWVAGFTHLRAWAAERARAFTPEAAAFGLRPARGVLLTGVPGCGKSFVAKAIAHTWQMPLLRLDAGSLYDSYVGRSERNLREALATAGSLAPSILWIDEIEKGFGSSGPSETDGGLGYRMLGALTTWMQERDAPVFVIATSNDITKLPVELTRQGRFDEIFFVDLPGTAAREHMFRLQLAGRGRDHTSFDCATLAAESVGFSGAEIEQSVTNALYAAFAEGGELQARHISRELEQTRPMSEVSPEAVARIQAWGSEHARPA